MCGVVHMPWIWHGPESEVGHVLRLDRDPLHAGNCLRTYYKGENFIRTWDCSCEWSDVRVYGG